jgi:hypothetical protein
MDSLRDFTTAALYGAPATAMKLEQIPTAALAETAAMLTGKPYNFSNINPNLGQFGSNQRDLSILGYENPQGFLQNAANTALSVIDPALIAGGASMLRKPVQQALKSTGKLLKTENPLEVVSKINSKNLSPTSWSMQEAPGLHLKSTMSDGPISKIVEPKTGLVNIEQAFAIIGKESGGPDKVALIKQGIGENIPKKMDFNEFRKTVQDQLIPLERQFTTGRSDYGLDRLGYNTPTRGGFNNRYVIKEAEAPIENQTLILGNKGRFGRGSSAHNNPDETLGHIHFLRDAETPDVLTVTQIQSDAFQGTHRIMPKGPIDISKYQKSLERMQKINETNQSILNKMKNEGLDEAGFPVQESQIKQFEDIVKKQESQSVMGKAELENFTQKSLLDKNHQERYLQELVDYGAKRGDVNKVRLPTSETAAKVQGYQPVTTSEELLEKHNKLKGTKEWDNVMANTPDADKVRFEKVLEGKIKGDIYDLESETILKKYAEQPKTIKKLFGVEPKIVTDSKGNSWYEFDIPKSFKEGKGEIKAFKNGGKLNTAQNGQEMKFYQNGLDWKPKSMQGGGEQPLRVSTSDPRYPELYKNRQVGSYYDGAYSLPDLPEFVVEGKDESLKEAMSQGSGRFLQGLAGVIGAPQAVTMELLTGKQQTPSEAFGFQQPGGWLDSYSSFGKNLGNFAMDAVLDPVNLLGVGLVDDVARASARVIANKPIQQFGRAAGSSDKVVFDLMDESIDPFGEVLKNVKIDNTPSSFAEDVQREALDYQQLTRDPRYLERVRRIDLDFGSNMESLLNSFNRSETADGKFFPFNISVVDEIPAGDQYTFDSSMGVSGLTDAGFKKFSQPGWKMPWPFNRSHRNALPIDPATDRYVQIAEKAHLVGNQPARGTVQHELKHHWTNALLDANNQNYGQGLKSFIAPRRSVVADPRDQIANKNYNYLSGSTEVDAHLMTNLRDEMVKRGYLKDHFDELSEGKLNDFLSEERDYRGVIEYFNPSKPMVADKSKFVDFFNKYGLPSTVIGGVLGGQAIDKQKNGGITKDNQGYWNPDNWGKPVEIDSNDITMEGVYEPLLGVSDTGDTKLMKPGKNYKFKGKKVTEFPVAQYGKGIPFKDAVNNPKDPADPIRKDLAPPIRPKASFEEQKRIAKLELDKYGYTSDQRKSYVKGKSEKAFRNIVPQGYGDLTQTLDRINRYEKDLGRNPDETIWFGAEDSSTGKPIYYDLPKRDDAFALYLGLPQKNKSFGISEYQPGDSKENKYYFKPNYLDENLKNRLVASYFDNVDDDSNVYIANERLDAFRQKTDSLRRAGVPDENPIYANWIVDNPLGDFKMSKGKDKKGHYISIYDQWDLNPFKQGEGASSNAAAATLKTFAKMKGVDVDDETEMSNLFGAGKPFEIYDRIYYDPKTKKVIPQKRNGGAVGINQLDAQPMKKLNQLLNFTNNPDKDNWLDKYN